MGMHFRAGPVRLLPRALHLWFAGRMHFPKGRIGESVRDEKEYVVFREMCVDPARARHEGPPVIFKVQFRFASMSARINQRLSFIPVPFIAAQPGFRSKLWMMDESTGDFQGIYEWDTVSAAEAYWTSFPMRLMKKRAAPGSIHHEVLVGRRSQ